MAKRLILSVSVWAIHRDLGQICDAMVVALLEDARAHLTRMSNGRGWADSSPRRLGTSGPYHVVDRWIETETNIEGRQAQDAWGVEKMAVGYAAVKNVSVISTGSAEMHREHMYGTRKPALWWVARGKEWLSVPLNVFVIEHERRSGPVRHRHGPGSRHRSLTTGPSPETGPIRSSAGSWTGSSASRSAPTTGWAPSS